jgi:2-dehydropantoate 2-reductase
MRIAILGAGAMGSYFGARLAMAGHEVTLLDPYKEHIEAIRACGLTLREGENEWKVEDIRATCQPAEVRPADVVVVLTKAHNVADAMQASSKLVAACGGVLVLSNGVGCAEAMAPWVSSDKLLHGATAAGAVLEGPGEVRHNFQGLTCFGPYVSGSNPSVMREISQILCAAGIEAKVADDPEGWIWTKLIVNIGYNAVTALTRVRNGELVRHPDGRAVLEAAVKEVLAVAKAKGIRIGYEDPLGTVLELGFGPISSNQSTMLQDVLRSRMTEIDFLNGAVAREGRSYGVATPVNESLACLVRILQDHYGHD